MNFRKALTTACIVIPLGGSVQAQTTHNHTAMTHSTMETSGSDGTLPTEPGQGAFAAIAEIVARLMKDPNTDWDKVNIGALRSHLVDMDNLVTHAQVRTEHIADGAVFHVSGKGPGGEAAGRMVPAHGPVLASETGWASDVTGDGNRITWTVTSPKDARVIQALGFFGLMAVGDHHREHHLGMATGEMMH